MRHRDTVLTRLTWVAGAVVVVVTGLLVANATRLVSRQPSADLVSRRIPDAPAAVDRLARALTYRTVADDPHGGAQALRDFHQFLEEAFPRVQTELGFERVADLSLLCTWRGRDPTLPPVVLLGHLDVVPAEADAGWARPPFGGIVSDGFVWGRGALDDKSAVLGLLEATDMLLREGFRPRRTVYLAFGHDEETGGRGARAILNTLRRRGVEDFALVLDEGGGIVPPKVVPGVNQSVALVGIAEKGVVNLELTASAVGGHASSPPARTAVGRLSRALAQIDAAPFPAALEGAAAELFRHLAPEMPFLNRIVFGNLWLFRPVVMRVLTRDPTAAAVVRTTVAPTMVSAGSRVNVLPAVARATINIRIRPGETVLGTRERIRALVAEEGVAVSIVGDPVGPSPLSDTDSPAFALLGRTVREIYGPGRVLVAPYLTIASVDARWYAADSRNVFRLHGLAWEPDATERIHGINERIAIDAYLDSIRFGYQLIKNSDTLS